MKVNNFDNFSRCLLNPLEKVSKRDRAVCFIASVSLGIITLGLLHLGVAIYQWKRRKIQNSTFIPSKQEYLVNSLGSNNIHKDKSASKVKGSSDKNDHLKNKKQSNGTVGTLKIEEVANDTTSRSMPLSSDQSSINAEALKKEDVKNNNNTQKLEARYKQIRKEGNAQIVRVKNGLFGLGLIKNSLNITKDMDIVNSSISTLRETVRCLNIIQSSICNAYRSKQDIKLVNDYFNTVKRESEKIMLKLPGELQKLRNRLDVLENLKVREPTNQLIQESDLLQGVVTNVQGVPQYLERLDRFMKSLEVDIKQNRDSI